MAVCRTFRTFRDGLPQNPERWTGATRNWDPQTIVRLNPRLQSLKKQINDESAAEETKLARPCICRR